MNEIQTSALKLSGVFARLKGGQLTPDQALTESLTITNSIDKAACSIEESNRNLRKSNANLSQSLYKQKENVNRLEEQINKINCDKEKVNEDLCSSQVETRELQEKLNVSNNMLASVIGDKEIIDEDKDEQSQALFQ